MDKLLLNSYLDPMQREGDQRRYNECPFCGKVRDAFIVTATNNGWVFWCHKCQAKGYRKRDGRSPKKIKAAITAERTQTRTQHVALPYDFSLDIPAKGKLWLAKYGITDADAKRFSIGYSEFRKRLIIPVFKNEEVVYWQGRNLDTPTKEQPKYINVRTSREHVWFDCIYYPEKPVILVEDVLSAINIHKAGYNAIALLGSYVSDNLIVRLLEMQPERVIIWLDPDKRKDSLKFSRRLNAFGISCGSLLLPTLDPKEYTSEEIRYYIDKKED